jgi:membrane protein DedA with SNARE-associated domain
VSEAEILEWLRQNEGPLAYLLIGFVAAVEYVFPPAPADAVALGATFLAATADYSAVAVYVSLTVGSVCGSALAYGIGRAIGRDPAKWPPILRRPVFQRAIARVIERFDQQGTAFVAVNRFIPAVRAVVFFAAGMAKLPLLKVLLWGAFSDALYNSVILAIGYAVGDNYELLRTLVQRYTIAALAIVALVIAFFVFRMIRRRKRRPQPIEDKKVEPDLKE